MIEISGEVKENRSPETVLKDSPSFEQIASHIGFRVIVETFEQKWDGNVGELICSSDKYSERITGYLMAVSEDEGTLTIHIHTGLDIVIIESEIDYLNIWVYAVSKTGESKKFHKLVGSNKIKYYADSDFLDVKKIILKEDLN